MLSASSSFIATNCPKEILVASLAVIGGRAGERATASLCLTEALLPLQGGADPALDVSSAGRVTNDREKPPDSVARELV